MTQTDNPKPIHQGRNVKRFREMAGLKQEALADMLGQDWSQKKVSTIEAKEVIEESLLKELALALKVPTEAIKSMNEESVFGLINNTFNDQSYLNNNVNYQCTINPFDEMKRLMIEKDELVKALINEKDALLKEKDEKVALLQKFLEEKK